jgi:hypothetical protein
MFPFASGVPVFLLVGLEKILPCLIFSPEFAFPFYLFYIFLGFVPSIYVLSPNLQVLAEVDRRIDAQLWDRM